MRLFPFCAIYSAEEEVLFYVYMEEKEREMKKRGKRGGGVREGGKGIKFKIAM